MPLLHPVRALLGFAAGLLAAVILTAQTASSPGDVAPDPALAARAEQEGLPLSGIDPPRDGNEPRPGDAISTLITLRDRSRARQWLAEFRVVALTPEEQQWPPATTTVHSSAGRKFEFSSRFSALGLRLFGPFELSPGRKGEPRERTARLLVKTDFLAAGFAEHCALILRARASGIDLTLEPAAKPFSSERVARDRALVIQARLTPEEEKILAATGPALGEFLGIAQSTPVLKELLRQIADFPPLWGLLVGGKSGFFFDSRRIEPAPSAVWHLPAGARVYRAPFHYYFRGGKVLQGEFHFTTAQPPLLTSAGILAVRLESPKNPQRSLELRILAARNRPTD